MAGGGDSLELGSKDLRYHDSLQAWIRAETRTDGRISRQLTREALAHDCEKEECMHALISDGAFKIKRRMCAVANCIAYIARGTVCADCKKVHVLEAEKVEIGTRIRYCVPEGDPIPIQTRKKQKTAVPRPRGHSIETKYDMVVQSGKKAGIRLDFGTGEDRCRVGVAKINKFAARKGVEVGDEFLGVSGRMLR